MIGWWLAALGSAADLRVDAPGAGTVVVDGRPVPFVPGTRSALARGLPAGVHRIAFVGARGALASGRVALSDDRVTVLALRGRPLRFVAWSPPVAPPLSVPSGARTLERGPTDRFTTPLTLRDGTVLEAIVDTGASHLALCSGLAEASGFRWTDPVWMSTPNGAFTADKGLVPWIATLGVAFRQATASLLPRMDCEEPLVGMGQLSLLEIGMGPDRMWVWHGDPPAVERPSATFWRGPEGTMLAHVDVDGRAAIMVLDTGAAPMVLSPSFAARAGLRGSDGALVPTPNGVTPVSEVRLGVVRVDGVEVWDVPAVILPADAGADGFLGAGFLKHGELRLSGGTAALYPAR